MITIEETTVILAPIERCFDLARSVEVHLAGNVNSGEAAVAVGGVTSGLIALGQRVLGGPNILGFGKALPAKSLLLSGQTTSRIP